ncbi:MAG: 16S rRNA (guanine(527)-N(7))-methyltransferase RsmG [Pseudohongiellaceae bacterium]
MSDLTAQLESGIQELGLDASPQQQSKLLQYLELLLKWNKAFNLTAINNPAEIITRHLLDSLSLAPLLHGETILDVGSGAGLPGIPLAIVFPHKQFVLLDSNGKKTRFLFQAKLELGLENVEVENNRIEHYQTQRQIDIVTCRAFSSLAEAVKLTGPLLSEKCCLLAMKGADPGPEISKIPAGFSLIHMSKIRVPGLDTTRHILEIKSDRGESREPTDSTNQKQAR